LLALDNRVGTLDEALIAVDIKDLTKGMFVSELDRPWLETPFVFQGFEISNSVEIDILRSHCDFVHVDVDRSNLTLVQVRTLKDAAPSGRRRARLFASRKPAPGKWRSRFRDLALRYGLTRYLGGGQRDASGHYPISSTVRREADRASAAYELVCAFHRGMLEKTRKTGRVDIGAARRALRSAIDSILRNPNAMAWVIFLKKMTPDDYNRAVATSVWCVLFGRHLAFDRQPLDDLAVGGLLLDIGNLGLPADGQIKFGELSAEQRKLQERHVAVGIEILKASRQVPENVMDMVRCHQERADGSGYPARLKGIETPSFGRIAAIADTYDAMTSQNSYSSASAGYDAARALNKMRGAQFQSEVVEQFLMAVGMFPTGSIVELNDGRIGVVLEQNPGNPLRPKVLLLLDKAHKPLSKPQIKQLRNLPADATSRKALWIVNGHEHGAFGLDPRKIFR
jgi:HD-GYP domain-containing protein (c-di-GMP phosphodiesterase class II)